MKKMLLLTLAAIFWTGEIHALPPVQHRVAGVVRSVNLEKSLVTIASEGKDEPAEFAVEEKRTRLRRDGAPVLIGELEAGQRVEIYYRKETGGCVATEISWKSVAAPGEKP